MSYGTNTHRTLFRLGEASALRASGELDRFIAALTAHAERRWIDVDELDAEQAPAIGATATIKAWWDKLDLDGLFDRVGDAGQLPFRLADAVFAMVAGRLCDPGSPPPRRWRGRKPPCGYGTTLDRRHSQLRQLRPTPGPAVAGAGGRP